MSKMIYVENIHFMTVVLYCKSNYFKNSLEGNKFIHDKTKLNPFGIHKSITH